MKAEQVVAADRQLAEELRAAGERHAREVEPEVGRVARAVAGAVEDGVDVRERVLGAEGGARVAGSVADEAEGGGLGEAVDEAGVQVGPAAVFVRGPRAEGEDARLADAGVEVEGE